MADEKKGWAANTDGTIDIVVKATGGVALYVVLTTLAQGRFSDNAFMVAHGTQAVQFIPHGPNELALLRSSLRVEHLQENL